MKQAIPDNTLSLQNEVEKLDALDIIKMIIHRFKGKLTIATSLSLEDQVLTDLVMQVDKSIPFFTLDTGRLPESTFQVIDETNKKYGIQIQILFPNYEQVEKMVQDKGPNLFYESIEQRKLCCHLRKVEPLQRHLKKYDVWCCGLRRTQSHNRENLNKAEWDHEQKRLKISPLADWSTKMIQEYVAKHQLPYNRLHDEGYPSIGCAPCTRAVQPGEDERAGRWWWETEDQKECGLHRVDGRLVPKKTTPDRE